MKKIIEALIFLIMMLVGWSLLSGAGVLDTRLPQLPHNLSAFTLTIVTLIAIPQWSLKLFRWYWGK